MEEVKGCFFLHIPMATKHGTFQWPPSMEHSNGHQAKNLVLLLPLTTKPRTFSFSFHWPPSQEPSPSPSIGHRAKKLHPLFKRRTWILGGGSSFLPRKQISIKSWECLFLQVSRGGEERSALELERGRRIKRGSCKSFQGMEVNNDRLEG